MSTTLVRLNGALELFGQLLFALGYFLPSAMSLWAGGGLLVLHYTLAIASGAMKPQSPLLLMLLGGVVWEPWYVGVFGVLAGFSTLNIYGNLIKIFKPQRVLAKIESESPTPQRVPDPFYRHLGAEQMQAYQDAFERIIHRIDVPNETLWSRGATDFDRERKVQDDELLVALTESEAAQHDLNATYLATLVYQFIFADPEHREEHLECWVERVLQREQVEFFPEGGKIYKAFFKGDAA